jgi:hypothetical protein
MTPVVELFSIHPQIEFCEAVEEGLEAWPGPVAVGMVIAAACVAIEGVSKGCLACVCVGRTAAGVEEMLQASTIRVSRGMITLIELFRDMVTSISV